MTPLSKVSILKEGCNNRLPESRSSDSVSTIDRKNVNPIDKRDITFQLQRDHGDTSFEDGHDHIQVRSPQVQNVLNRQRTFDISEESEKKCSKKSTCITVYDKNDNKAISSTVSINNNITKKRNSILSSSNEKYFHSPTDLNSSVPYSESTPIATSSKHNAHSLLLLEKYSNLAPTKLEGCQKLSKDSSQMNCTSQSRNDELNKSNEIIDKTYSCDPTESKLTNQIVDSKEKIKTIEQSSYRHISSNVDEPDKTLESQSLRTFIVNSQEEENKRDSLDLDESLEILTASQMNDGFSVSDPFLCPDDMSEPKNICPSPLPSPNFDLIFQENVTLISDTTINLELTLDTADKSKNFGFARLEATPSPEELPLDPIPIVEIEPKSEATKSKTNSFITSITSITSLDTGYQGDGEMSRPGSRGADNSPLTRRPLQRPPARRTDAMTDSDFFTESDADNHDDNVLRGDRRAQVIDGTLYGVDPQAAADIYVNNRENMDSSGIFTDIESNTRTEELLMDAKIDISPTDTSSKTLSENSQTNLHEVIAKNLANNEAKKKDTQTETSKKRGSPSPVISTTSSTASPRHLPRDDSSKKYKTLKREVQSKVKMLLETNEPPSEKKTLKKPAGRWDAVMNKISKSDSKTNFQEVKSRVFNGVNSSPPNDAKKLIGARQTTMQKSPNNKLRRVRTRVLSSPHPSKNSNGGSIHSSLSDLSAPLPKKNVGSVKKREAQVTQVLTATKLSPKLSQQTVLPDGKRRAPAPASSSDSKTPRKGIFSPKEKKQISNKENGRSTVKGGRTSPVIRSPTLTRATNKPVPKTAEALAVLVQHLVFNVEAFEVPCLRKQVKKYQEEAEAIRLACQRLEEQLLDEKEKNLKSIEEERLRWHEDVARLIESHRKQISQITLQHKESKEELLTQHEQSKLELKQQLEEKLGSFKREFERFQKTHEESVDILREENEAIRDDIDAKNDEIRDAKHESLKLQKDYEAKEYLLKEQIQILSRENQKFKQELSACKEDISKLDAERTRLLEENKRLLSYREGMGVGVQEVESLRVVLELKQTEVGDLRKSLAEVTQKAEMLASSEEKVAVLQARCEDLQLQLQRKNEYEKTLQSEMMQLKQSLQEEVNTSRRISLYNEELKYKLNHNREVITKFLEQTNDDGMNKSGNLSTSLHSDRYSSNNSLNQSFKTFVPSASSFSAERNLMSSNSLYEDDSPPTSPKIKGVVEKSDSVSYVLDLDESPAVVASRLVRRSFRNSLNQKNTPTKSPCNKRPRVKSNPLSQSSSASSLLSSNKVEFSRSRSVSVRNGDDDFHDELNFSDNSSSPSPYHYPNLKLEESPECKKTNERDLDYLDDNVLDLNLPALPSELGCKMGVQALPRPKHLAGEAMVSESNSEDESTSSSSGQL